MKMNFQIMNTPHPNSIKNMVVFAAYERPDTKTNLYIALRRYRAQVKELQKLRDIPINHVRPHSYKF